MKKRNLYTANWKGGGGGGGEDWTAKQRSSFFTARVMLEK
jgi:hypothetical protein